MGAVCAVGAGGGAAGVPRGAPVRPVGLPAGGRCRTVQRSGDVFSGYRFLRRRQIPSRHAAARRIGGDPVYPGQHRAGRHNGGGRHPPAPNARPLCGYEPSLHPVGGGYLCDADAGVGGLSELAGGRSGVHPAGGQCLPVRQHQVPLYSGDVPTLYLPDLRHG